MLAKIDDQMNETLNRCKFYRGKCNEETIFFLFVFMNYLRKLIKMKNKIIVTNLIETIENGKWVTVIVVYVNISKP